MSIKNSKRRKKVIITGSKGCIGSILKQGLSGHDLYFIDLKERAGEKAFRIDVAGEYKKIADVFSGKDVVIHLAWNFSEDFLKETIEPKNKLMAENVYKAAVNTGIKRIIIASSVHANDYSKEKNQRNFDAGYPFPDSPYGASKIYIESLGKYYANYHGLEVICIRFGGVNGKDVPILKEDPNYDKVLLYKKDVIDLINCCIKTENVPNNFKIITAVSKNRNRVHIIKNFLNWQPQQPKS